MGYRSLRECVDDLASTGRLVRIEQEIDPRLEAAEIQRRVYAAGGPAVYFARLKGCRFPAVSNLFGTVATSFIEWLENCPDKLVVAFFSERRLRPVTRIVLLF